MLYSTKSTVESLDWRKALASDGYVAWNGGAQSDLELLQMAVAVASRHEDLVVSPIATVRESSSSRYVTLTRNVVPMHTDGMYLSDIPRYVLLYCDRPATTGGDTYLISGEEIIRRMDPALRTFLISHHIEIHLAGHRQERSLVVRHPDRDELTFTFFDPALDSTCELHVEGRPLDISIVQAVRDLVSTAAPVHCHAWQKGDLLVFDNLRYLHGRTAFTGDRSLKRILIGTNSSGI